uniref:BTB domain-containing protein n=1 Tax=Nelumbo nucifera TaxID=4432 RepID=A0A822XII3_NELNU|nr:TPA_asm: hypothetical protein HUJ06_020259 [Nelumbo nucifera]
MMLGDPKKRQRVGGSSHLSTFSDIESPMLDDTLTEISQKPLGLHCLHVPSSSCNFKNPSNVDVILHLYLESSPFSPNPDLISSVGSINEDDIQLHLHSDILRRSKYFFALLSDRWKRKSGDDSSDDLDGILCLNLKAAHSIGSIHSHLTVLHLLYTNDFSTIIGSASCALAILPVTHELLFEDCIRACV